MEQLKKKNNIKDWTLTERKHCHRVLCVTTVVYISFPLLLCVSVGWRHFRLHMFTVTALVWKRLRKIPVLIGSRDAWRCLDSLNTWNQSAKPQRFHTRVEAAGRRFQMRLCFIKMLFALHCCSKYYYYYYYCNTTAICLDDEHNQCWSVCTIVTDEQQAEH